jgi:DNA mismatch repair protein MutS
MRQVGLIVILAQVGCLVPARTARLGVTDRIFTRVGAVDDVSLGQSTFQVEMAETAVILAQATSNSLVLLDEIGRGTSVSDGIAIAWAVAEHMAGRRTKTSGLASVQRATEHVPRTIFVTHYHELNELGWLSNVRPFHVQLVRRTSNAFPGDIPSDAAAGSACGIKVPEEWICTHRIVPGASWASHGISIARRAGFPCEVIARAEQVLETLKKPSKEFRRHLRLAYGENSDPGFEDICETSDGSRQAENEAEGIKHVYMEGYDDGFAAGKAAALQEVEAAVRGLKTSPGQEKISDE